MQSSISMLMMCPKFRQGQYRDTNPLLKYCSVVFTSHLHFLMDIESRESWPINVDD